MIARSAAMVVTVCGPLLLAGCALFERQTAVQSAQRLEHVKLRFHLASTDEQEGYHKAVDENGLPMYVAPQPFLTEAAVWNAALYASEKRNLVRLELTHGAAVELERVSRAHLGRRLAILVDDELVVSPFLSSPITKGTVYLDGRFSKARAKELVRTLNAQCAAIGPDLGAQDR